MPEPGKKYYVNEFGMKRSGILCRLTYPKSAKSPLGEKKLQQQNGGQKQFFVNIVLNNYFCGKPFK